MRDMDYEINSFYLYNAFYLFHIPYSLPLIYLSAKIKYEKVLSEKVIDFSTTY
jgi:hypothetical protein